MFLAIFRYSEVVIDLSSEFALIVKVKDLSLSFNRVFMFTTSDLFAFQHIHSSYWVLAAKVLYICNLLKDTGEALR